MCLHAGNREEEVRGLVEVVREWVEGERRKTGGGDGGRMLAKL